MAKILFNKPWLSGREQEYIRQALVTGELCGNQPFTKKCQALMKHRFHAKEILLTTSCTSALEMAALLCDIGPGDEVILPSFTFVSTANAFLLRGATLRFVDIRPDTFNLDEQQLEQAISKHTKVIVAVHYASIGCEMDTIMAIARQRDITVVEDAAQAVDSQYKGRYLGTLGDLGTYSFHETKNFVAGEGGALVINRDDWLDRAEIIREKGTNRHQFMQGQVNKYSWVDVGSSYVPSDIQAALLLAQLESMDEINRMRADVAQEYRQQLTPLEERGIAQLPVVPSHCTTNNHMFSLLFSEASERDRCLKRLRSQDIMATFHYVPLHNSPLGQQLGTAETPLPVTERVAASLLRLPLYPQLRAQDIARISDIILSAY